MIVAFGNPVYDDITTPVATTRGRVLSGGSTNSCLALTRLGHSTTLVGRLGADFYDQFMADTARFGVDTDVQICEQTGGYKLVYDTRGDRTLDVLGVAAPIEHVPPLVAEASAVLIGPILQETPLPLVERIRAATDAPLFLDPQGFLRRIGATGRIEHFLPPDLAAIAPMLHAIKANELEAEIITGVNPRLDGAEALRRLKALGSTLAIITLAEAGSLIDDGQQQYVIPAYTTDVRDPTGAGDTYMAGFVHAYQQNPDDLYRAGCFGAATASLWIEQTGPAAAVPLEEVNRRATSLSAVLWR